MVDFTEQGTVWKRFLLTGKQELATSQTTEIALCVYAVPMRTGLNCDVFKVKLSFLQLVNVYTCKMYLAKNFRAWFLWWHARCFGHRQQKDQLEVSHVKSNILTVTFGVLS